MIKNFKKGSYRISTVALAMCMIVGITTLTNASSFNDKQVYAIKKHTATVKRDMKPFLIKKNTVIVPNCIGLDFKSAVAVLNKTHLKYAVAKKVKTANKPANLVISQSIAGNKRVQEGSIVNLVLSAK